MNTILILLVFGAILASTSVISAGAKSGILNGALSRTVAGGSLSIVGSNFLAGYSNLESFISASANGSLGFSGYIFLGGLSALLITWASNIIEFGTAVK